MNNFLQKKIEDGDNYNTNQDVREFKPFVTEIDNDVRTCSCSGHGEVKIKDQVFLRNFINIISLPFLPPSSVYLGAHFTGEN